MQRHHSRLIPLLLLGGMLLTAACTSSDGPFRLEGRFRNMNQAEFYLYDAVKGWKDTIIVRDGRLSYQRNLDDTATLTLLFPNFTAMPIFAQPGARITVKGDASHLRETEIEGTQENEDMTAFRLQANQQTPPEVKKAARQFIEEKPASPVSLYLLQRYFLQTVTPDYKLAYQLCDSILHATENGLVVRLHKQLQPLGNAPVGSKLPAFSAKDTKGKTVTQKKLQAQANVIIFWASWSSDSRVNMAQLRRLHDEHKEQLAIMAVALDAKPSDIKPYIGDDSLAWHNICDGKMWQSPLVTTFGIATVPACIVADKQGNIVARNPATANDLKEKVEALIKTKEKN